MNRVAAFLLLTIYLCASTEAYQLLKMPAFVTHFIQHCNKEPKTTLLTFLAEHYSGTIEYDDDYKQDMKLPFKYCDFIQMSISPTITPEPVTIMVPILVEIVVFFTPIIHDLHNHLQIIKIFQPPKYYV